MNFETFITEGVETNDIKKKTGNLYFSLEDFKGTTVKTVYNGILAKINAAPVIANNYAVFKQKGTRGYGVTYYALHKAHAFDQLRKIHKEYADQKNVRVSDSMIVDDLESVLQHKDVVGAKVDFREETMKGLGKCWEVGTAETADLHQGQGLMQELYAHIIRTDRPICSNKQSAGARKMWWRLGAEKGITVNAHTGKYIIKLTRTNDGYQYTRSLWDHEDFDDVGYIVGYKS